MAVKRELRAVISADDRAFQRRMAAVKKTALEVGQSLVAIGLAGGVAFLAATRLTVNYGNEIDKMSEKLGMSREEFQRFRLVAAQAGLTSEQFGQGMLALQKNLGAALNGEQSQIKVLRQLGLTLSDIRGKSAAQQLMIVGDALGTIEDRNKRLKAAGTLFGDEAGAKMMQLFARGAKSVAEALNGIDGKSLLTDAQVDAAARLNGEFIKTKAILMGGLAQLLADTWPVMQENIANATAELQAFMQTEEFSQMRAGLVEIVTQMGELGREMLPLVKTGLEGLSQINAFAKPIEGLTQLIGLLNDWKEATANTQEDEMQAQPKIGGNIDRETNQKENEAQGAARNARFFLGLGLTKDSRSAIVEEWQNSGGPDLFSALQDRREKAAGQQYAADIDKLIKYLETTPLGEGR